MASKTISIDLDAYDRLNRARLSPKDSFSQVIKRAHWDQAPKTCRALLSALPGVPLADEATLRHWDEAQAGDAPPENSWA